MSDAGYIWALVVGVFTIASVLRSLGRVLTHVR